MVYVCDICNRPFENRFSYAGHRAHCLGKVDLAHARSFIKIVPGKGLSQVFGTFSCFECDKKFESNIKLWAHRSHCLNPNRNQYVFTEADRKVSQENYRKNLKTGKTVVKGRPHNEKTRELQRQRRIEYMQKHPEKTAWSRRGNHNRSNGEMLFERELISRCIIGWTYDYPNGIYKYDFGFINEKIDVEIDGSQHNTKNAIQRDKMRDEWSTNQGWTVIRFKYEDVIKDTPTCVDKLETLLIQ